MSLRQRLHIILLSGALALCPAWAQADALTDVIEAAQSALQQGDAQRAYTLLAEQEASYAGNVDYDYWFGLSAVRAGKPARATFALERVVAEQPNHAGARVELAAAWLQLGQRDAAADQLDRVERMNPPPQVQEQLDALNRELNRQARSEQQRRNGGFVGIEYGDDDNVGSWPEGLEFFPGFKLDVIDSAYMAVKGGYWHRFDVAADQKLTVAANALLRRNDEDDAEQFDQDYVNARVEWARDLDGRNEIAAALDLATLRLDGEDYYLLYGLSGEWRRKMSDKTKLTAGAQLRQFDFDIDQYDYMLTRLLARISHRPAPRWELGVDVTVDYEASDEGRAGGDALVYGLAANGWYQLVPKHRVGAQLGYSRIAYSADYRLGEALTLETGSRDDDRLNAALLYDWFPGQRWQVRAQAQYRDQSSSLETFTYDQTVLSAGLNYYF